MSSSSTVAAWPVRPIDAAHRVGLAEHVVAGHPGGAARRLGQRGHHPHGRRLAGAVGPEQPEHRPLGDREADVVDGGLVTETLDEVLGLDRQGGHGSTLGRGFVPEPTIFQPSHFALYRVRQDTLYRVGDQHGNPRAPVRRPPASTLRPTTDRPLADDGPRQGRARPRGAPRAAAPPQTTGRPCPSPPRPAAGPSSPRRGRSRPRAAPPCGRPASRVGARHPNRRPPARRQAAAHRTRRRGTGVPAHGNHGGGPGQGQVERPLPGSPGR